ncbi:MAG: methyltransferase domain-containing protein [Deltaproteobacteria bacterium]|nr:methyltransferase domain-containing protein [Deltaproteobacteria bacterium]
MPFRLLNKYDAEVRELDVGPRALRVYAVKDINALVDAMGPEDFGPDERLPYWATVWPSSLVLAREVLSTSELEGPVLELGCGLGVGSIAAAMRGLDVLATDHEPDALAFLEKNAALNEVAVSTRAFDWRDPAWSAEYRTILASDVLYEERKVIPLAETISALLHPGGVAWVADPGRGHLPYLELEARDRGLVGETVERESVSILKLKKA